MEPSKKEGVGRRREREGKRGVEKREGSRGREGGEESSCCIGLISVAACFQKHSLWQSFSGSESFFINKFEHKFPSPPKCNPDTFNPTHLKQNGFPAVSSLSTEVASSRFIILRGSTSPLAL